MDDAGEKLKFLSLVLEKYEDTSPNTQHYYELNKRNKDLEKRNLAKAVEKTIEESS